MPEALREDDFKKDGSLDSQPLPEDDEELDIEPGDDDDEWEYVLESELEEGDVWEYVDDDDDDEWEYVLESELEEGDVWEYVDKPKPGKGAKKKGKGKLKVSSSKTYKAVQETTANLNEIYRDGAAVAFELKDTFEEIKEIMDPRSFLAPPSKDDEEEKPKSKGKGKGTSGRKPKKRS